MTHIYKELVSYLGGQGCTASKLGVSQGTVSGWVRGIHGCSAEVALLAEKVTLGKFPAVLLRPSLHSSSSNVTTASEGSKGGGSAVDASSSDSLKL